MKHIMSFVRIATGWRAVGVFALLTAAFIGVRLYQAQNAAATPANAPNPDALSPVLEFEAARYSHKLQLALGEIQCGDGCMEDTDFSRNIEGLVALCAKLDPPSFRTDPNYQASKHKAVVDALTGACGDLTARTDKPTAAASWRNQATKAKNRLAPWSDAARRKK